MLTRMEITDTNDLVNSLFEPCAHFTAARGTKPAAAKKAVKQPAKKRAAKTEKTAAKKRSA